MPNTFSKKLLKWYEQYGRHDLPWQKNPTAYRVWISEIMLQQTQVTTVIGYYDRFMKSFPTVKSLAMATEDAVLSHWSGLGYYARARNIHKTAKIIDGKCKGKFPSSVEAMSELPGIGKSTAGAIISFSLQKKAVILDGNVKRVLARYFAIDKPVNQKDVITEMWALAEKLTPEKNAAKYNQAIMDLGATLCTSAKPRCSDCPFIADCAAYKNNQPTFYPVKIVKKERPVKKVKMYIVENKQGELLLLKRPSTGIWGGLWSFPECENDLPKLKFIEELPEITHQFTHFTLIITPVRFSVSHRKAHTHPFGRVSVLYRLGNALPGGVAAPVTKILNILSTRPEECVRILR
ncbi:MAG: A/G-specific adenine glycosylase [Gammaproteobacteria bacterium RIFCSPHIGHO2_12_FULL_38_11]|nr:MAG: A/G-specific adenine glycosylase [Gammaproteobacteria bacterium RIFCSPHIGHO2_12_FULL_38_11]